MAGHRSSFSQDLRQPPGSPRFMRSPGAAAQELLNYPPVANKNPSLFANRDWKSIAVDEITDPKLVRWVEEDTAAKDASDLLTTAGSPNVVLVRKHKNTTRFSNTFDYSDLNAYLLVNIGVISPTEGPASLIRQRMHENRVVLLNELFDLAPNKEHATLPHTAKLTKAVEIFGSGEHRIIIFKEGSEEVVGILTQLRMVNFFWEHNQSYAGIEHALRSPLREVGVVARQVIAINGDKPLKQALDLMHRESITSLPVLDSQRNVIGNISHVDVRLLTDLSSLPLLDQTCIHFVSIILSQRGMEDGKDSFPIFYVNPHQTLAHTVAKLVATASHRMWVVDAGSQAPSVPQSPLVTTTFNPQAIHSAPSIHGPPYTSGLGAPSSALLAGQAMSGRLSGVVSLTDVLNIFARASGLNPTDPSEARRRRRRSSSSSVRASIDSVRSSFSLDTPRPGASTLPKR